MARTTTKARDEFADMSRDELVQEVKSARNEAEGYAGEVSGLHDQIGELEGRIEELEGRGHINELVGIRDDLRAGRHAVALDRITRFLDTHAENWRTLAPAYSQGHGDLFGAKP